MTARGVWSPSWTELAQEEWICTTRLALVFGGEVDAVADLPSWEPSGAEELIVDPFYLAESNFNLTDGLGGGTTFSPVDFLAGEAISAWQAIYSGISQIANGCFLDSITLHPVGADGKVQGVDGDPDTKAKATIQVDAPSMNLVGLSTQPALPPDVACAFSWDTLRTTRRGRGRMYLAGLTSAAMGATSKSGVFSDGFTDAALAAGIAYINALTGSVGVGGPGGTNFAPIVTGKPWARYSRIQGVRVGQNPDTQRRRTRQVAEKYKSAPTQP